MADDQTAPAPAAGPCPPRSRFPLLPGVRSRIVRTPRLEQHIYESGPAQQDVAARPASPGGEPLLLVHGNASSARFFEDLMAALALAASGGGRAYHIVAPDHRGYGASEAKVADATRGLRDYSDDLHALVETLGWDRFHLLGWSLGGNIAMQYVLDHPERVRTLTLHAPGSPYGYGGTHGAEGTPNYDDFAGSGGGLISSQVVERYLAHDETADSPFSPRSGLRTVIVKPTFTIPPEREDALVEQMLLMAIGDQHYPGDGAPSPNWPFSGPGVYGSNNALSPKYCDLSGLGALEGGPPILWLRGADDRLVSDMALADPAALGKLGAIPGWPGDDVCPPQPMLAQLRAVLDRYRANGGWYEEHVFADCGHAPLIEKADEFRALFEGFLARHPLAVAAPAQEPTEDDEQSTAESSEPSPALAPVSAAATAERGEHPRRFGWLRRRR